MVSSNTIICLPSGRSSNPQQASLRRLAKDYLALQSSPPPNYLIPNAEDDSLPSDDLTQLDCLVTGADGTPYAQGLWRLHLRIPSDYPKNPPKATFKTRIYHPNVDEKTGAVCLETLKRDWDPKLSLKDILVTISCLLIQPNPDSALNAAAGSLIQENYEAFTTQAQLMTKIHAPIPKHLNAAVQQAKRRGEEVGKELPSDSTGHEQPPEPDDTKENDSRKSSVSSSCPRSSQLSVKGKRPLADVWMPEDADSAADAGDAPKRKSPKTTRPEGSRPLTTKASSVEPDQLRADTDPIDIATSKQSSFASRPTASRKGSGPTKRVAPRVGIRRL